MQCDREISTSKAKDSENNRNFEVKIKLGENVYACLDAMFRRVRWSIYSAQFRRMIGEVSRYSWR